MASQKTREVLPIVAKLRNFLMGRDSVNGLRFKNGCQSPGQEQFMVKVTPGLCDRPGPEPDLPPGPSHKLESNYYYTRDARREYGFPTVLADSTGPKAIAAGGDEAATAPVPATGKRTPGARYNWGNGPIY